MLTPEGENIMQRRSKRTDLRCAFTLMEMLLVLAILVILIGLVGPRILGSQRKADVSATKIQIGSFKETLHRYAIDMKRFPTTEEGLVALAEEPSEGEGSEQWDGPYLDATDIPKDPWGREYQYEYPPSHGEKERDFPDIWSLGPDGEDGTEDDIVNWTKESSEES
jgi:general secretion pathway protein G